jgi:hypothetical protein
LANQALAFDGDEVWIAGSGADEKNGHERPEVEKYSRTTVAGGLPPERFMQDRQFGGAAFRRQALS